MKNKKQKKVAKKRAKRTVKPALLALPSPIDPKLQIVVASEMQDDAMIEADLMGEVLPFFIYEFQQDGGTVRGLTVKGVSEMVRRLNRNPKSGYKIHINPAHLKIERDVVYDSVKGVEVWVFAEDLVTGNSAWGTKFEPYTKNKRGGGTYPNTFALEKALSKAERNAKKKLIPEQVGVAMIAKLIKQAPETVKKIEAPVIQAAAEGVPAKSRAQMYQEAKQMVAAQTDKTILRSWKAKIAGSVNYAPAEKEALLKLINEKLSQ